MDSFQGKEPQIVIVDMVAAKDNLGKEAGEPEADDEDGEKDPGTEDFVKIGRVTSHVRRANRLNAAHTRG